MVKPEAGIIMQEQAEMPWYGIYAEMQEALSRPTMR